MLTGREIERFEREKSDPDPASASDSASEPLFCPASLARAVSLKGNSYQEGIEPSSARP